MHIMKPTAFSATSVEQMQSRLGDALKEGLKPTLAIVFSSVAHDLDAVSAAFARHDIDVFGASTNGEICNDEIHDESIVAMLLGVSRNAYQLRVFDAQEKTSGQVGQNIGEWAKTAYDNPAVIVMSGGLLAKDDHIVNGIISAMGRRVPLFGGLAGDDLKMQKTFVFNTSQVTSNGVMALVFDGNVIDIQELFTVD